ncbi:MAG TPA: hypothetical protein VL361_21305 [Candidatus Limnocylindrales bacterium]|jgi:hypothetical protein|nr:hypothetical protein [Candidatus Limnocylindrales bacterium]
MTDKDDKIHKPGSKPIYEAPDGTRMYRQEDLTDAARERLANIRKSPEFQRKLREQAEAPTWEYAISDGELPENADAAIVRFSDSTRKSLLVFRNAVLNDRLVSLARVALIQTRSVQPVLQSQQIVLVWSDGTLKTSGEVTKLENLSLLQQGETERFRARSGSLRQITGLGDVRVVGSAEEF